MREQYTKRWWRRMRRAWRSRHRLGASELSGCQGDIVSDHNRRTTSLAVHLTNTSSDMYTPLSPEKQLARWVPHWR